MYLKYKNLVLMWRILILISTVYGIYGGVYLATKEPNAYFLLYYTTQSNLWCFLFYLYLIIHMIGLMQKHQPIPKNLGSIWLKGGITAAIILTFFIYQFIIVPYCLKNGAMHQLFSPSDIAVHYLSPFLVLIDYILCNPKQCYTWVTPLQWLVIPYTYLSYIVARTFFHRPVPEPEHPYLYFFLDWQQLGLQSVAYNILGITIIFLAVGYFIVLINQIKCINNIKKHRI